MNFSQLPREIADEILEYSFLVRGWERGMRLRLVNKAFANDLLEVIHRQNLLGDRFNWYCIHHYGPVPPFTVSYLAAVVLNGRLQDMGTVGIIRAVAQRLTDELADPSPDGKSRDELYREYVHVLCRLMVERRNLAHFFEFDGPRIKCNDENITHGLLIAATYLNIPFLVKKTLALFRPRNYYVHAIATSTPDVAQLFGTAVLHALRYGSLELLRLFPPVEDMPYDLHFGAEFGSLACTQYLYDMAVRPEDLVHTDDGWIFDPPSAPGPLDIQATQALWARRIVKGGPGPRTLSTPSVEILKLILAIQNEENKTYQPFILRQQAKMLNECARKNWVDMARYLIDERATGANITWGKRDTPLLIACKYGHREMVDVLLDRGADTEGALSRAVEYGHADLVRILINRGVEIPTTIIGKVVARGNIPLAKMLLEHGANPNDSYPLVEAVSAESTALFELLLTHGAVLDDEVKKLCFSRANREELESMSEYLQRYELKLDERRICAVGDGQFRCHGWVSTCDYCGGDLV